jgi:hypothetical protein
VLVLVLVSDGGDNASSARRDQVLARARRANVTLYTIGLMGGENRDNDPGLLKRLRRQQAASVSCPGRTTACCGPASASHGRSAAATPWATSHRSDRATLTLVTCYPFEFIGHAPKRFIVSAELASARRRSAPDPDPAVVAAR